MISPSNLSQTLLFSVFALVDAVISVAVCQVIIWSFGPRSLPIFPDFSDSLWGNAAEDKLQSRTDSRSSFSASFISHFTPSHGQRKMSVMKCVELRASWKQGSCQLSITLIKPNLSSGGFLFITLTRLKRSSPTDLCGDPSSASRLWNVSSDFLWVYWISEC